MARIHATARRCDKGSQVFGQQLDISKFGCLPQDHFQRGLCLCPPPHLVCNHHFLFNFLSFFPFLANATVESLEALCRHFWPPVPYMNEAFSLSSFSCEESYTDCLQEQFFPLLCVAGLQCEMQRAISGMVKTSNPSRIRLLKAPISSQFYLTSVHVYMIQ